MPIISVILPTYNSERYIERCLYSVLNQTFRNIEVIVVNDGSTDGTEHIVCQIATTDKRVKYVSQKNAGAGKARNYGLQMAVGKYVAFIDSDDWIDGDLYEKMYREACLLNADVVFCDYLMETQDGKPIQVGYLSEFGEYNKEQLLKCQITGYLPWGPTHKIIKRQIITQNKLSFMDIKKCEESKFSFQALFYAKKIAFINSSYYHYIQRSNSLSRARVDDIYTVVCETMEAALKEVNAYEQYHASINGLALSYTVIGIYESITRFNILKAYRFSKELIRKFGEKYDFSNVERQFLMKRVDYMVPLVRTNCVFPVIATSYVYRIFKFIKRKP